MNAWPIVVRPRPPAPRPGLVVIAELISKIPPAVPGHGHPFFLWANASVTLNFKAALWSGRLIASRSTTFLVRATTQVTYYLKGLVP
jgi:hypothetical protein